MNKDQPSQPCACPSDAPTVDGLCRHSVGKVVKDAASSRLFLMTTLGAATGQVPALAADGVLANPTVAVTVGLTVVAGVGAFLAAVEEATLETSRGRAVFTTTALMSIGVNVAAAGVGVVASQVATLEHLRYFAAAALGLIAWEIARDEALQAPGGVPAPGVVIAAGVLVEALV